MSLGQSGTVKDTSRCYGLTELRQIAKTAVDLNTCDTLLSNAKAQISNRESMVKEQAVEISTQKALIGVKDQLLTSKDNTIQDQKKELKKLGRRLLWTKIGWVATAVAEATLIILIFFI